MGAAGWGASKGAPSGGEQRRSVISWADAEE
jgi:hypothetical protein